MTLTRDDAALALGEMQRAQARATILAQYSRQGAGLIAWGLVWMVCNLVSQFSSRLGGWAWLAGVAVGACASFWVNTRGRGRAKGWRSGAVFLVIAALIFAVFAVSPPRSSAAIDAAISLYVAGAYALLGLWAGWRWLALGVGLAALVLVGWFAIPAWFFLWMALAGGGALILGGLWLRSA